MLFIPVTRPWAVEPVMTALNASDIPRSVVLLIDAPGCEGWFDAFVASGWNVTLVLTHNSEPPSDRIARRERHILMRRWSQDLLRDYERVLCVEDDTLVPPDVWSRLSALMDEGYTAASGVQYGRYGQRIPGIWTYVSEYGIFDPIFPDSGAKEADAVGHYCLMTTGDAYAQAPVAPREFEPVDIAHTKHLTPIAIDWNVVCGHLLEDGTVIL